MSWKAPTQRQMMKEMSNQTAAVYLQGGVGASDGCGTRVPTISEALDRIAALEQEVARLAKLIEQISLNSAARR